MSDLFTRLRQRKLFQWALAYAGGAWLLLQVVGLLSDTYGWPAVIMRVLPVVVITGLLTVIVIAWSHGERGAQRVRTIELVIIVVIVAAGSASAWLIAQDGSATASRSGRAGEVIRLSVLPFEIVGDTTYASIAEGISDEIRGKLARLPGVDVIARASSVGQRESGKTLQAFGTELRVRYLLTGTVRVHASNGVRPARIQVTPELVEVMSSKDPPVARWQEPFDADLTDIFEVQSAIATRVADGMNLALDAAAKGELEKPPTENLAAYEEFQAGLEGAQFVRGREEEGWKIGVDRMERAVALDPKFVEAWARMATWSALMQFYIARGDTMGAAARRSRAAADRAMKLDPGYYGPMALGTYLQWAKDDYAGAADMFRRVLLKHPSGEGALNGLCVTQQFLGRWVSAAKYCDQAASIDPRNRDILNRAALSHAILGDTASAMRQYRRRALLSNELDEDASGHLSVLFRIRAYTGDLAGARAVLDGALVDERHGDATLNAAFHHQWGLFERRHLERMVTIAFRNDSSVAHLYRTLAYAALGDTAAAKREAALLLRIEQRRASVSNYIPLAVGHLVQGDCGAAVRVANRAIQHKPLDKDGINGPRIHRDAAWIYLRCSQPERALDVLTPIFAEPRSTTAANVRIDPRFAALRGNSRFEALVAPRVQPDNNHARRDAAPGKMN